MVGFVLTPMSLMRTCVDWLFSGKLQQFPRLKLVLSEGGIGWIPHTLELCEQTLNQVEWWSGQTDIDVRQLFRDHIYGCFIEDVYGLPGLGQMMTRGLQTYDLPVLLGVVVFMTFSILVLNLLIDVCYTFCDPRVRAHASIDKEDRVDVRVSQPAPAPRAAQSASS